jgi:hypothetical protein
MIKTLSEENESLGTWKVARLLKSHLHCLISPTMWGMFSH